MQENHTMMQYFEWYLPSDCKLWNKLSKDAKHLENIGIDYVWVPPAYKGAGGKNDTGYGVYDLYDLGEFDQKGSIETKYGTKEEYLNSIRILQENNIKVLADIVLNHRMGADETEEVLAVEDDFDNRNVSLTDAKPILAWTKYNFPSRGDTYSSFKWNWTHFHGIDWNEDEASRIKANENQKTKMELRIPAREGENTLTILAVDASGNSSLEDQIVRGYKKPKIELKKNRGEIIIIATDEEEITKVVYEINGMIYEKFNTGENKKVFEIRDLLVKGKNIIKVTAYNKAGETAEKTGQCTY